MPIPKQAATLIEQFAALGDALEALKAYESLEQIKAEIATRQAAALRDDADAKAVLASVRAATADAQKEAKEAVELAKQSVTMLREAAKLEAAKIVTDAKVAAENLADAASARALDAETDAQAAEQRRDAALKEADAAAVKLTELKAAIAKITG